MFKNCRKTCGCQLSSDCGVRAGHESRVRSILHLFLTKAKDDEGIRVVGGKDAKPGQYPWQVGIWHRPTYGNLNALLGPFCSGTLITKNAIITAAHCFKKRINPADFYVRLGDVNIQKQEPGEIRRNIKKIILHKNFHLPTFANDIALIILKEPVRRFTKFIKPACLPEKKEFPTACHISGWGKTSEDGPRPDILQHVKLPVVSYKRCNKAYKALFDDRTDEIITNSMICAGYDEGKKDACQYDSGGPLSCKEKVGLMKGRFFVNGIVSFGSGCARAQSYGVYTNVFNYIHWIRKTLNWEF